MKILQMPMAIDKSRQNSFAFDIDDGRAFGNCNLAGGSNPLNPPRLDDDYRIVHGSSASAVDQFSALHDHGFFRHSLLRSPELNYLPSSLPAAQSDLLPMADWLHVYR